MVIFIFPFLVTFILSFIKVAMIRDRHIEFKLKKNQKVIRMVAIKQYKNFLAKPEGKLRLGLVTHTTSKKKHK